MQHTAQPGRIAHLTFPKLGWIVFQYPEPVTVIKDYPAEQQAEIMLADGRIALYPYSGTLEAQ
jgi:hypothetical protein